MTNDQDSVTYTDEPIQLGQQVEDLLPPPEELVFRRPGVSFQRPARGYRRLRFVRQAGPGRAVLARPGGRGR